MRRREIRFDLQAYLAAKRDRESRTFVKWVLRCLDGNVTYSAYWLRISRRTLYNLMERHGIPQGYGRPK